MLSQVKFRYMRIIRKDGISYKDSVFLHFGYDASVVERIKAYPKRTFHPDTKEWEFPAEFEDRLKKDFREELSIIEIGDPVDLKPIVSEKILGEIPEDFSFKVKPFDHQIEGVRFGIAHDSFLLGDEMGLGKTLQALNIAVMKKDVKRCLVICCVNGIKWNWRNEIEKFTDRKGKFIGEKTGKRSGKIYIGSNKEKVEHLKNIEDNDAFFLITNIETLRSPEVSSVLAEMCASGEIGMVIVDEAHKCINPDSKQTEGLLSLKTKYRIAMTGTPIMNRPTDLFVLFSWLGYEQRDFFAFRQRYCLLKRRQVPAGKDRYGREKKRTFMDIVGYRNLEELQITLGKIMLRRTKDEVLDLPEKIHVDEYVEMDSSQKEVYDAWKETEFSDMAMTKEMTPAIRMIRLRQVTADPERFKKGTLCAKLDRMEELVEEAVGNGRSVCIFSIWKTVVNDAVARLSKYNPVVITGGIPVQDRVEAERRFQSCETKVLAGTVDAMGTGLNFTKATVEIFLDEPWTEGVKDQCESRGHRIGQTEKVTVYTLLTKDTVDEKVHDIVLNKGNMASQIVDGKPTAKAISYILDSGKSDEICWPE